MKKPLLDRQLERLLPLCNKNSHKRALRSIHDLLVRKNGAERKHDAMILTVAYFLVKNAHEVLVEYKLPSETETLYADIYAVKGDVSRIYEVEIFTYKGNFVPVPGSRYYRKLSKDEYFRDRIIGKVARYWRYADEFYLVFSRTNAAFLSRFADLFEFFRQPVEKRPFKTIQDLTLGVGNVYRHPSIPEERIRNAFLSGIYGVEITRVLLEKLEIS